MNLTLRLVAFLAFLVLPLSAFAQVQNEDLANGILAARKKEASQLQQYSWNSRTEITQDEKIQDQRIDQVTYGADGSLQRSLINDQPGQLPGGFFRKAIAENQRKQLEEYVRNLGKIVDDYTLPSAGKVIDFVATAKIQPITSSDGKTLLQLAGTNIVTPGDTFTMIVDGTTLQPISFQITTTYEGAAVTVSATFKAMKNGPNHLQYATAQVPDKNLTVNIHNYDYVPND